jgi:hypothetical protein
MNRHASAIFRCEFATDKMPCVLLGVANVNACVCSNIPPSICPSLYYLSSELVNRYGIGIRVLGDDKLLPEDVRKVVRRAVELTKKNNRAILNMCFPYTSREELTMASRSLVSGIEAYELNPRYVFFFFPFTNTSSVRWNHWMERGINLCTA